MSPKKSKFAAIARKYCDDVISGDVVACKKVRQACERYLRDLGKQRSRSFAYFYDEDKAELACARAQLFPHVKGRWARIDPATGRPSGIKLEPWQVFILCSLFGWVKKANGMRRFRKASIYVPRKNAKSTLAAIIGWLMFAWDDEPGAEVYSGATSEKQAWEVFGPARQMAILEPRLPQGRGVTVNAQSLVRMADNSKFEPIIGKPGDGASPHCAIIDEYHEHPTSVAYDTMLTGMGAREQPLLLVISTAGDNVSGPCRDDWKIVEKILAQIIDDDTHFGIIFTIDEDDEWTSEIALRKANPNFDVSVSKQFLLDQQKTAIREARQQGIFKIKHLNVRVTARSGYFNVETWRKLGRANLKMADFTGRPCVLAIDLASKVDIAAVMALFPNGDNKFAIFGKYFLPSATVELPENQHYQKWRMEGRIEVTEGERNSFAHIADYIVGLTKEFDVREATFDPDGAAATIERLQGEGIACTETPPTMVLLSDPMKELDAMIKAGQIEHDSDPVLEWSLGNVVTKPNFKDQVYPTKERDELKIDPAVGAIMAVGRRSVIAEAVSVYETRGVISL